MLVYQLLQFIGRADLFEHIVPNHMLMNLIFLTEVQCSDKGALKMTANSHPAFDMEEHFERLAETYEEMAVCTKDASRDLTMVVVPESWSAKCSTLIFLTDFPLSTQPTTLQP